MHNSDKNNQFKAFAKLRFNEVELNNYSTYLRNIFNHIEILEEVNGKHPSGNYHDEMNEKTGKPEEDR